LHDRAAADGVRREPVTTQPLGSRSFQLITVVGAVAFMLHGTEFASGVVRGRSDRHGRVAVTARMVAVRTRRPGRSDPEGVSQ